MADEVVKRKVQTLTAGGAPKATFTAIFIRKEGGNVKFITDDGRTFSLPESEVQISDPIQKKQVTKTKKGEKAAPAAAAPSEPRVGRENTIRGMTGNQRLLDAGNAMQRRIYRGLKRTEGWYSLSLAERVEINIKALKKAGISSDLIPGVVDQMSRQYLSGKGALTSERGREAVSVIERWAGSKVTGGVRRVLERGVSARKQMGAGNVYTEEGKVEKRTGKSRREIIKTGSRGGTSRVPTPAGGYATKGKEVTTTRAKALESARRVTEGFERIESMKGEPRMSGKRAAAEKYPEGVVSKKVKYTASKAKVYTAEGDPTDKSRDVVKTREVMFKDGFYYVPDGSGKIVKVPQKEITSFLSEGASAKPKGGKRSSSVGVSKASATTRMLLRESRIGSRMNDERLVKIAREMIAQARSTGNVPKEGGYTALLMKQPQFEGIDSKDLRRIIALAKADAGRARVERRMKKAGKKEYTGKRTELSILGRDITEERPRTKKQKGVAAAVKAAEEQIVREDLGRKEAGRKDRRAAALAGKPGRKEIKPAKPITMSKARLMEQEIAEGKRPSKVFKKQTVAAKLREGAAAGKVKISEPRLSKRDREALKVLEGIPDRRIRIAAADRMKLSTKVRSKAMSRNLLSLAGMYGANYILSQLGEESRKKGKR